MTHADQGLASYRALVAAKQITALPCGFTDVGSRDLLPGLFDHQKHCLEFALRAGRSAQFLDTGLGKTALALAWGDGIVRRTNRRPPGFQQWLKPVWTACEDAECRARVDAAVTDHQNERSAA